MAGTPAAHSTAGRWRREDTSAVLKPPRGGGCRGESGVGAGRRWENDVAGGGGERKRIVAAALHLDSVAFSGDSILTSLTQ